MEKQYITEYLKWNAENFGDKLAIAAEDGQLSWRQLWEEVETKSASLAAQLSDDRQDLVSVFMPNTVECVVAHLAILHAGHIVVPIDVIYKSLEIEAILNQIPTALVLTDQANRQRFQTDRPVLTLADLDSQSPTAKSFFRMDPTKMVATIFFTSGTTGKPKAVPNTHANHLWNIKVCSQAWQWSHEDSLLLSVRLPHMLGSVMGLSGALYHGNSLYLQDRYEPQKTLEMLSSGKITLFSHAPLAYAKMLEVEQEFDVSTVRLFISGSGPLPPAIWRKFKDRFGAEILEVYGSSETGRIASNLLEERIPGSPGRPLAEVDIKISPEHEILVKSPGVFPGYYQNEELTKQNQTEDGYWRTGDIGEIKDGRVILKGRTHEIIRRQGYTVSPRDIEWALLTNQAISEVSVLGLHRAEESNDFLVYFMATDLSDKQVIDFCKQALPSVWRPDKIVKLEKLPRTSNGKVSIASLKAMLNLES